MSPDHGIISGLACKCFKGHHADFFYKGNGIVCANCGRSISLSPPVVNVYEACCKCCSTADVKSTFVVDSKGRYICTWCHRVK